MKQIRIAVLGVYRSGSTAVAGALHHLGVDMGPPFFEGFYESAGLSKQLRRWWDEPRLVEKVGQAKRVTRVGAMDQGAGRGRGKVGRNEASAAVAMRRGPGAGVGAGDAVHPLLPLEDSIDSLKRLGRTVNGEFLQGTLVAGLDRFFAGREHLAIEFADLMTNPRREVERLMEYLQITAEAERIEAAVHFIEPGTKSKVETEQGEEIGAGNEPRPGKVWGAIRRAITGR